jgi:Zn-dependent M28 family amino/carboxypeptidase
MVSIFSERSREKKIVFQNARDIIYHLSVDIGERTIRKYENLERSKKYIIDYFTRHGAAPEEETYTAAGMKVSNVIAEIRGSDDPDVIILVGAHYDTIEDTPGADDNASGVAALLELFRLLSRDRFKKTLRFVAFTLEEPPFFSTKLMGSMIHAHNCKKRNDKIELMVCLEMMGYGSRKHHQEYPVNQNHHQYPARGDYISVISLPSNSTYVNLWKNLYNAHARSKIYAYIGPASVPGMDMSDHMSFIRSGYPAIMISDTGFYRNKNYHTSDDRYDTINFKFLTDSIFNSHETLRDLLNLEIRSENQ